MATSDRLLFAIYRRWPKTGTRRDRLMRRGRLAEVRAWIIGYGDVLETGQENALAGVFAYRDPRVNRAYRAGMKLALSRREASRGH